MIHIRLILCPFLYLIFWRGVWMTVIRRKDTSWMRGYSRFRNLIWLLDPSSYYTHPYPRKLNFEIHAGAIVAWLLLRIRHPFILIYDLRD